MATANIAKGSAVLSHFNILYDRLEIAHHVKLKLSLSCTLPTDPSLSGLWTPLNIWLSFIKK